MPRTSRKREGTKSEKPMKTTEGRENCGNHENRADAKTAKTRKPRKRHLYTMIYGEGYRRWRVKSATWRLKRNLLEGSLPYNIAKSLQVGRICMRPSWIAPWECCFCLCCKFNTETEGIDGSRCSYMVTYIPCKEIRSADVRCENARSTDVRCKV